MADVERVRYSERQCIKRLQSLL